MYARNLYKVSRVCSNKMIQMNRFEKFQRKSLLLVNYRCLQQGHTTDIHDMNQYPDTDRTKNVENNGIRDNVKSSMKDMKNAKSDIENNFNQNAQNIKKSIKDNYSNLKSDVKDSSENMKENVKDNYQNLKYNVEENTQNAKEKTKSTFENMKENMNENYKNAKEKIKDSYNQFKDSYENKFNNTTQNIKEGMQNVKHNLEEKVEGASEDVKEKYDKTKKKANEKTEEAKSKMENMKEDAKSKMENVKEEAKEKYEKTKKKANEKTEEAKSKMENMKEESKSKMGNMKEKTKETFENIKNEITGKMDMNDMLHQARVSFENLMNMEDSIKKDILKDAKAIIFLSITKSGLGISGVMGSGVMITRMDQNGQEWSGPIAVGLTGVSIGLNAGFEKADNILIIRDEQTLKQLSTQRELQLGGDIAYVMGKGGYNSSFPFTTKEHENIPVVAYSMTKGAYISLSLKGEMLKIKNESNEEYYKQKINVADIMNHKIKLPHNNEYNNLIKLLNDYYFSIGKNGTMSVSTKKKTNVKSQL